MEKPLPNQLEEALIKGLEDGVYPGCVLVVGTRHDVLFEKAVGYACIESDRVLMDKDTIFDLASLTKPLATALAIMKLVDRGKIDLRMPIREILGEELPDDKKGITIRQLLCHSAGLADYEAFYRKVGVERGQKAKAEVRRLILERSLECMPGTTVRYSDLGFMLLEWVVALSSGVNLPDFVTRHFYGPLGLRRTFFQEVDSSRRFSEDEYAATEKCPWRGRVIRGYVHDENAYVMGGYSGHAGLFSTGREVYTLCASLARHYHGERQDLLTSKVVREFFTRQPHPEGNTWALGWDTPSETNSSVGKYFSKTSVGHLGFTGTSVWIDLDKDLIVVLLTNRIHPLRENQKIHSFRPYLHDVVMMAFEKAL